MLYTQKRLTLRGGRLHFNVDYFPNLSLPVVQRREFIGNELWTTGEENSWWKDRFVVNNFSRSLESELVYRRVIQLVEVIPVNVWINTWELYGAGPSIAVRNKRIFTLTTEFVDYVWSTWSEL